MFLGEVISQTTSDYAYYYTTYTTDYNSTFTSSFTTTYDYPDTSATDQPGSVGFSILIFL